MRRHRLGFLVLAAALGALAAAGGCGSSSSSTGAGGGGSSTSSGTGKSSSSGSGSASGSGSTSSGSSSGSGTSSSSATGSSSGSGTVYGYCARPCPLGTQAECCPAGSTGCPSDQYPNNYKCNGGACREPECTTTADCAAQNPKLDCFNIEGVKSCAFACATDPDCTMPLTCIGKDNDGKKYCLAKGSGCMSTPECGGLGQCKGGVCVCETSADCTKSGFTACAL
jgi:hypothetical protein